MELDTKRKLIIGALHPRHNTAGVADGVCPHNDGLAVRDVGLQERLLRDLVRRPAKPAPDRRLREPAVGPHVELYPGLQVHLDRRPGAARLPELAGHARGTMPSAFRAPRRSVTAGRSGSPTCATRGTRRSPTCRSTCIAMTSSATTRTTSTRTSAASPGSPAAAASAATPPPAGTAPRTSTACAARSRTTRSWSPAAAWSWTHRRCAPTTATTAWRRTPTSCTTPAGRPTARPGRRACKTGNVLIGTEEDFTGPCDQSGQDRRGRPHRFMGRRARAELDARQSRTG